MGWRIWPVLLTLFSAAPLSAADWSSHPLPEYDRLFQQTNGWIGADGDYTVKLPDGQTLWLFSDTFVGRIQNHHRHPAKMIHNSAAWQQGLDPATARVKFFYGKTPAGEPTALIAPADGRGWFWIFDGTMADGKLILFLVQIESKNIKSAFGFRQFGNWLGSVANPLAPPTEWQVTQRKIPFAKFTARENLSFGASTFKTNGYVYVFGTRDRKNAGHTMILARAPETRLDHFASWQFRARNGWTTNVAAAAGLCDGIASEYSVSWLPASRQYVLIYTDHGLSDKIMVRTAPQPWGPWSRPAVVYRCPETRWDKRNFCYAAKAHPMLATAPDELIVTHAANSFEFNHLTGDARLYWPRFVRVKWHGSNSHQPQ